MLRATDVTVGQLSGYIERHRRWRGVPRARQVALLADHRAASCGESRLRVLWMEAGLARPEVNRPALDLAGRLLGVVDLVDEETGLVAEYDGWGHREERRHATDNVREELLEAHGMTVVRVSGIDLHRQHRRRTVWRLRQGAAQARLGRVPRRWMLGPWRAPS